MNDLIHGDCLEVMRGMDAGSVDSIVTDPPYGIKMFKSQWDSESVPIAIWQECLRVVKYGGHILAFSAIRNQDIAMGRIRDAGFEIRDTIIWLFSGFPNSVAIDKWIDKRKGKERKKQWVKCGNPRATGGRFGSKFGVISPGAKKAYEKKGMVLTDDNNPISDEAKQWAGYGTQLKPTYTPIIMARKQYPGNEKGHYIVSLAEGVLKYGGGVINIKGCKVIATNGEKWPANTIVDSDMCEKMKQEEVPEIFYCAKTSARENQYGMHPSQKPINLMRYLVRLVTPPGGIVLDPFAGTGTTLIAAHKEGMEYIGIEKEKEYYEIAEKRIFEHTRQLNIFGGADAK